MKSKSSIVENLVFFVESKKLNDRTFEKMVGWSNGFYGKVKTKNINFSIEKLDSIHQTFPELNIHWLITGEGRMILTHSESDFYKKAAHTKLINAIDHFKNEYPNKDECQFIIGEVRKLVLENQDLIAEVEKIKEAHEKALKMISQLFSDSE